jgi:trehalose 6-phosphate phosphatase
MRAPHRLPPASAEWAYFLDVDGTLIELAQRPDAVHVPAGLRCMMDELYRSCNGALAVVSGRSLDDLDGLLRMPGLPMAGQHGLEWRSADRQLHQQALMPSVMQEVHALLAPLLMRHPGLLLEFKGASLAVHYRLAPRLGVWLQRTLTQWLESPAVAPHQLEILRGKYVLEVRPRGHDKGSAIAAFMREAPFDGRRPVFVGDDVTDEHGFAMVNGMQGLSVKVGRGTTSAAYRLPNVQAVHAWLGDMVAATRESI